MATKLDLYRIFSKVGKSESFSKAAKDLYMTQPAVSQAISQLERELDIRLFNRTPKGVSLTNEGQLLFEYVNSAIHLIHIGEEKLSEFKNLTMGELKIGVGDTISKHFLLPNLDDIHIQYPNIKFKIINGTTLELCPILKSGDVDIIVCNFPLDDPSLKQTRCTDVHDVFVCGEKYSKRWSEPLSFAEVVKLPLIMLEPKSNSRQYVEDYLISKGIKIAPEFELGSHDLLLEFAKINLGVACVTKEFAQDYLSKGLLYEVPVEEAIPARHIGICSLKSVPLSPASTRFVDIIVKQQF